MSTQYTPDIKNGIEILKDVLLAISVTPRMTSPSSMTDKNIVDAVYHVGDALYEIADAIRNKD